MIAPLTLGLFRKRQIIRGEDCQMAIHMLMTDGRLVGAKFPAIGASLIADTFRANKIASAADVDSLVTSMSRVFGPDGAAPLSPYAGAPWRRQVIGYDAFFRPQTLIPICAYFAASVLWGMLNPGEMSPTDTAFAETSPEVWLVRAYEIDTRILRPPPQAMLEHPLFANRLNG